MFHCSISILFTSQIKYWHHITTILMRKIVAATLVFLLLQRKTSLSRISWNFQIKQQCCPCQNWRNVKQTSSLLDQAMTSNPWRSAPNRLWLTISDWKRGVPSSIFRIRWQIVHQQRWQPWDPQSESKNPHQEIWIRISFWRPKKSTRKSSTNLFWAVSTINLQRISHIATLGFRRRNLWITKTCLGIKPIISLRWQPFSCLKRL